MLAASCMLAAVSTTSSTFPTVPGDRFSVLSWRRRPNVFQKKLNLTHFAEIWRFRKVASPPPFLWRRQNGRHDDDLFFLFPSSFLRDFSCRRKQPARRRGEAHTWRPCLAPHTSCGWAALTSDLLGKPGGGGVRARRLAASASSRRNAALVRPNHNQTAPRGAAGPSPWRRRSQT